MRWCQTPRSRFIPDDFLGRVVCDSGDQLGDEEVAGGDEDEVEVGLGIDVERTLVHTRADHDAVFVRAVGFLGRDLAVARFGTVEASDQIVRGFDVDRGLVGLGSVSAVASGTTITTRASARIARVSGITGSTASQSESQGKDENRQEIDRTHFSNSLLRK